MYEMSSHPVRRTLDRLYKLCGLIAAFFTLSLLVIIVVQMVMRWSGSVFSGASNYAGYCMAAATFFALSYAFTKGAHIRVGIVLNSLGRYRRIGETWCFGVATALTSYLAFYCIKGIYWSYKLHDVSQGQDAMDLWIVQLPVGIGSVIFAITLLDYFVCLLLYGLEGIGKDAISTDEA